MHEQVERDALEFGAHVKAGGWRLALLVARNVEKGKGEGGDRRSDHRDNRRGDGGGKVSLRDFARVAGESDKRCGRYLAAWEKAAKAGVVPFAATLNPGDEPDLDVEQLPAFEDYYDASKAGGPNGSTKRPSMKPDRDTVIREARKLIAEDQTAAHEVMDDPKARMRAASAIHGHRAAAEAQVESEEKTRETDQDIEVRAGMMLLKTGGASRHVKAETIKFGREWARLQQQYADIPEETWEVAYELLAKQQAEIMAIFDAARGVDLDSVLDAILAEESTT